MKLFSGGPSIVFNETLQISIEVPNSQPIYDFDKHRWTKEIPLIDATNKLEQTMYPFKEVKYKSEWSVVYKYLSLSDTLSSVS